MGICEILGDVGDYLQPIRTLKDYVKLYNRFKTDPTMLKYCDHGGRYVMWLPYTGWKNREGEPTNITYYKSTEQLGMHEAWRQGNGIKEGHHEEDYCIFVRMGNDFFLQIYVVCQEEFKLYF